MLFVFLLQSLGMLEEKSFVNITESILVWRLLEEL